MFALKFNINPKPRQLWFIYFSCFIAAFVVKADMQFKPIKELPADIPTCQADDLNLNECIKTALQQMVPRVKNGIPALNIPPMDPYELNQTAYQYSSGLVNGRVFLKNVHVYGLSNTIVQDVNFKTKGEHMTLQMLNYVPEVLVEGHYKADVKLNELKLTPKGYFNITMTNLTMKAESDGEFYEHEDHTYLRLTKFSADIEVADMRIYASGLFPDPDMNSVVLEFINQYWKQIYKAVLPGTRTTWEPFMLQSANEFFAALPIDFLLTKN